MCTSILKYIAAVCSNYCDGHSNIFYRDPDEFWTSGQWMTERRGGSDVSASIETIAIPENDHSGYYLLTGNKWFSSAADSDIAITLGRTTTNPKNVSIFLVQTKVWFNYIFPKDT